MSNLDFIPVKLLSFHCCPLRRKASLLVTLRVGGRSSFKVNPNPRVTSREAIYSAMRGGKVWGGYEGCPYCGVPSDNQRLSLRSIVVKKCLN